MSGPQQPQQPQQQRDAMVARQPGCADCVRDCVAKIPAVTRILMVTAVLAAVAGYWVYPFFEMNPYEIVDTKGLELYRVVLSVFVDYNPMNVLFLLMLLFSSVSRLELFRGSMSVLYWAVCIALATNASLLVLYAALGLGAGVNAAYFRDTSLWAATFGLMAVDAMLDPQRTRRFACCPCDMPTRWQPVVWLLIIALMRMGLPVGDAVGMAIGYAFGYFPALELRADRVRRWERPESWLSWLQNRTMFLAIDRGGQIQPWAFGQPPQPREPEDNRSASGGPRIHTMGSGRVGGGSGAGGGASGSGGDGGGAAKPSVFSGAGHKLTDPSTSSGTTTAASGAGAAAGAAGGKTHRPGMGHVLADRLAKAAAGAGGRAGGATATATTTAAAATVPVVGPISSVRPGGGAGSPAAGGPASATATATPSASSSSRLFTVGGGDDDGGDDDGEGVGEARDSHVAIAVGPEDSAVSSPSRPSLSSSSDSTGAAVAAKAKAKDSKKSGGKKGDVELQAMLGGGSGADDADADPFQAGISRLTALGHTHEDALRAMNAADGDVERAIQQLRK